MIGDSKEEFRYEGHIEPTLRRLRVQEIMDQNIPTLRDNARVSRAQELFSQHNLYSLPIVNQEGVLQGVISHKYLYKTQSPRKVLSPEIAGQPGILIEGEYYYDKDALDRYSLSDIMHASPVTISPKATVAEAIELMSHHKIGFVPVVRGNRKVVGMLSNQNVIDVLSAIFSSETN